MSIVVQYCKSSVCVAQMTCFPKQVRCSWPGCGSSGSRCSRAAICCWQTRWPLGACWHWETRFSKGGGSTRIQVKSTTGSGQVREGGFSDYCYLGVEPPSLKVCSTHDWIVWSMGLIQSLDCGLCYCHCLKYGQVCCAEVSKVFSISGPFTVVTLQVALLDFYIGIFTHDLDGW